jgi:hypothetical protein
MDAELSTLSQKDLDSGLSGLLLSAARAQKRAIIQEK